MFEYSEPSKKLTRHHLVDLDWVCFGPFSHFYALTQVFWFSQTQERSLITTQGVGARAGFHACKFMAILWILAQICPNFPENFLESEALLGSLLHPRSTKSELI